MASDYAGGITLHLVLCFLVLRQYAMSPSHVQTVLKARGVIFTTEHRNTIVQRGRSGTSCNPKASDRVTHNAERFALRVSTRADSDV